MSRTIVNLGDVWLVFGKPRPNPRLRGAKCQAKWLRQQMLDDQVPVKCSAHESVDDLSKTSPPLDAQEQS